MVTTDEAALRDRLQAEGLTPSAWDNGPHDRYAAHEHGYDKVIVVAAGSIRFGLPRSAAARTSPSGIASNCRPAPSMTRSSGRTESAAWRRHLARGTFDAVDPPRRRLVVSGATLGWPRSGEESPSPPQCGTLMRQTIETTEPRET